MWKHIESAVTAREIGQILRISVKIVDFWAKSTEFYLFQAKTYFHYIFVNWDVLHASLNSHCEPWRHKKKKHKKIKSYRKFV